ncbi:MAG: DUF58 domain-containing protein [Proteobacteria bacterium]|nr:DUF58 domain-containing protein [Pseudomonadota bacterium]
MMLTGRMRARAARWVLERQGPDVLPVTLHRRRLYILPTRRGLAFTALLLPMLLAGLNYANSLALFLTFLGGAWGLVVMHQCHRNLLGATIASAGAPPHFARAAGTLVVTLANSGPRPRLAVGCALPGEAGSAADLPAGESRQLHIALPPRRRGVHVLGRVRVYTTQPFGLFRAWTWLHAAIDEVVYPDPSGRLPPPAGEEPGSARAPGDAGHEPDEWSGLRPFREGDSPRHVDWKAYAREAPLLVKEYRPLSGPNRMFDPRQLRIADLEQRLSQLARWIVDAEARGERYGLILGALLVPQGRGTEHRHRCLSALAAYTQP